MVWKIAQKLYTNYTPLVSLNKEIFTLSSIQKCWRRSFIRQEKNISSFSVLHSISLSKEKYLCKKSSLFTKGNIPFLKERLWGNICVWSSSGRETYPSLYTISLLKEIQWIVWTVVNTFGIGFLVLIKNTFRLLKLFILFTTIH